MYSVTGASIDGASVVLTGNKSGRYETTSDAAGHFEIKGIAPGNYRPDVKKDGFTPPTFDLWRPPFEPGIAARFREYSREGGTPTHAARDDPRPGIQFGGNACCERGGQPVSQHYSWRATDREGRFALHDIRPGSYTLIARPPQNPTLAEENDGIGNTMVTTYYPSVADQSLVEQIVIPGPGGGRDYEIRMQTAPVHRVRGIVLDEQGRPSPEAQLTLLPAHEGTPAPAGLGMRGGLSLFALGMRREPGGVPEAIVAAGKDGRFEFPAVRSGDWRIDAVSYFARDARGTAGLRVGRSDVDDLEIHMAAPLNLNATIEWKSEDPGIQRVSDGQLLLGVVTLINPNGNEFAGNGFVESGTLLFANILPGRYQTVVKPGLSAEIFLGQANVTGQTFPVTADGPPLRVVLKRWSGTVRGTVDKGDGATVVLIPQRVEGVVLGQTIVCGAGGSFELSEVSPGDYYIAAFDHPEGLFPSAAMLSLVPSRGKSVKVEEHATANVMLSVIASH